MYEWAELDFCQATKIFHGKRKVYDTLCTWASVHVSKEEVKLWIQVGEEEYINKGYTPISGYVQKLDDLSKCFHLKNYSVTIKGIYVPDEEMGRRHTLKLLYILWVSWTLCLWSGINAMRFLLFHCHSLFHIHNNIEDREKFHMPLQNNLCYKSLYTTATQFERCWNSHTKSTP